MRNTSEIETCNYRWPQVGNAVFKPLFSYTKWHGFSHTISSFSGPLRSSLIVGPKPITLDQSLCEIEPALLTNLYRDAMSVHRLSSMYARDLPLRVKILHLPSVYTLFRVSLEYGA